jgi:hypothetical protein
MGYYTEPVSPPVEYFNGVPVSHHRKGNTLARRYGYGGLRSLSRLVGSLPVGAEVLDVGAGRSSFGTQACRLRPDIRWINADPAYSDEGIRNTLEVNRPTNLSLESVSAQELTKAFGERRFDRVYSWWMLPHITGQKGEQAGQIAVEQMLLVAKLSGQVAVGPQIPMPHFIWRELTGQSDPSDLAVIPAASYAAIQEQARAIVGNTHPVKV